VTKRKASLAPQGGDEVSRSARWLGMIHVQSSTSTVRSIFVVDNKAVVRTILYYSLELGRNIKEILRG
jgi:peroxiredoxin (alkyl hydroperoxide reductase subunit C)